MVPAVPWDKGRNLAHPEGYRFQVLLQLPPTEQSFKHQECPADMKAAKHKHKGQLCLNYRVLKVALQYI